MDSNARPTNARARRKCPCALLPAAGLLHCLAVRVLLGCAAGAGTALAAPPPLLDVLGPDLSELPDQGGDPGPQFGAAVAADGEWLLVGMPFAKTGTESSGLVQGGYAGLYRRAGDRWNFQGSVLGNVPSASDGARCGHAVGVVHRTDLYLGLVVGCPNAAGFDGSEPNAGLVLLRSVGDSGGGQIGPRGGTGDRLGASVAAAQTSDGVAWAAVGAPGGEYVRVYRRAAGAPSWSLDTTLTAGNGAAGDLFGHSVAVAAAGSSGYPVWIAVGAPQRANLAGTVYVFRHSSINSTWSQVAQVSAPSLQFGDLFGASVAYWPSGFNNFDDLLVVGAPNRYAGGDSSLDHRRGTVSVFRQGVNNGSFTHDGDVAFNVFLCSSSAVTCEDRNQPMAFGTSVAVDADGVWIGAPGYDQGDGANVGRVYRAEYGPVFGSEGWWVRSMVSPGALSADCVHDPNAWGRSDGRFGDAVAASGALLAVGYPRRGCALEVPPYTTEPRTGQVRVFGTPVALFADGFE